MIDFALIADFDPGGDIETAFASIAAETKAVTAEYRMNYLTIACDVGLVESAALETVISNAIAAGTLPKWVDTKMNGDGLDINNSKTVEVLGTLIVDPFTQTMADAIIAAGVSTSSKFPNLKLQHVTQARAMRTAGKV